MSLSLSLSLSLSFFGSYHVSLSLWSNVSRVTSLWDRSMKVFSKCICLCHCLCLCLCICLFIVFLLVRSCLLITISQRSQVSRVALWRCPLIGFVFVFSWSGHDMIVMTWHDRHVSLSDKMSPGSQVALVVMLLNRCINKEGGRGPNVFLCFGSFTLSE